MDDLKRETVALTGNRVKATILPLGLCISCIFLYFVPCAISLALNHTHLINSYAQPAAIATPERILYQIFASPTICFILATGLARYIFVRTICQLQNLGTWVRLSNYFATFVLFLSTFAFFLNTNITDKSFHDINRILLYVINTGFIIHFAFQIPVSFKLIDIKRNENIIGLRILTIFIQIIFWLVECLARHVCSKQLHGMLHCEKYLSEASVVILSWILPLTTAFQFLLYFWDFKTTWIDTHIYVKDEKKQYTESMTKEIVIYNAPNYSSMRWIPSCLVTFLLCSVIVPMITLVAKETKEFTQFPSISPDGPDSLQADLYACFTAVSAYLGFAFVLTQYSVSKNILEKDQHRFSLTHGLNSISAFTGIMMFIGLNVAGIILLDKAMHTISSGFFFLNGLIYMTMLTGITHATGQDKVGAIKVIRALLVLAAWFFTVAIFVLVILINTDSLNIVHFKGFTTQELLTFLLNVFEWTIMMCMTPFFWTFAADFKAAYLNLTPSINNTILDDRLSYKLGKLDAEDGVAATAV